jgi:demethylmenaquinone methyltransferase/2-methoxy-6-polyprenyl-1,4-benzoquinol methylase
MLTPESVRAPASFQDPTDRRFLRGLFDWLAPRYESVVVTYSLGQDLRWKHVLVRELDPRAGERALDLGCGTGPVSERLARRLGDLGVVGLDLNPRMLEFAHRRAPQRSVLRGDAQRLPFPDRSFDLVSTGYLFKYVELDRLVREIRRVLRPGGRLGGYDFSAPVPGTLAGKLYGQYLRGVLPWVGRHRDDAGRHWSHMLEFLADIAPRSRWEERIADDLRRAGFCDVRRRASMGGAITWVWARVPGPA